MRIIKLAEVKARTGEGHSTIYEKIREGTFPRQVRTGKRSVGWIDEEIDQYIRSKIAERDAAVGA